MYQHQVKRRCRVRAVTCCVAATSSRGLVLVVQSMKVRNVAALTAVVWVVRGEEALQVVQRQRVVPLEVVPFFFIAPSQTGHRGLLVFTLADPTVRDGSEAEHMGGVLSRTVAE